MSLIGMGNAYNSAAERERRFIERRERLLEKMDDAEKAGKERTELRNRSVPLLSEKMDELYEVSLDDHSDRCTLQDKISNLQETIRDERFPLPHDDVLAGRLKTLEGMVSNVQKNLSHYHSTPSVDQRIRDSIGELYTTFLSKVEGKFGQEIYERLKK
ncbi:MAG: hypothetical protein ACLFTR_04610 [Candidatus Woesearchaeota archaeon]